MKIALIQLTSSASYLTNLQRVSVMIENAMINSPSVVILPEYFIQLSNAEDRFDIAQAAICLAIQSRLSELALQYRIYIVAGTIPIAAATSGRYFNATLVFGPDGRLIKRYDKIHLFRLNQADESYNETLHFDRGSQVCTFMVGEYKFGLAICYDLRFPELFREMGEVDAIILPAAFTETTGKAHWEILCRARAIENQCYFLAVNQGGWHESGHKTFGHTMAIDPWGSISDSCTIGEDIVYVEIDKNLINRVRSKLPALNHRVL